MDSFTMEQLDLSTLPSPCYVVDEAIIERNLVAIDCVRAQSGAKVLLALKAFAMWTLFPVMVRYLDGAAASSLNEARLGRTALGGQVHVYAPAYREDEFDELVALGDHIIFNSFSQWRRLGDRARERPCGIRINPEISQVEAEKYDPCAPGCRLGVTRSRFEFENLDGITGLHFHTLCQQDASALQRTLEVVERKFGSCFGDLQWINFGGGHCITQEGYEVQLLVELISDFGARHKLEVFLEPGAAIASNSGVIVATVLDLVRNDIETAILDVSATAHMPDVLEMPYRPDVLGAARPAEKRYTYRLGGPSCLAGDVIGDYSFDEPLRVADRLVFTDMAHYTMVKNTNFNGLQLPALAIANSSTGRVQVVREFGYEDYRRRLS